MMLRAAIYARYSSENQREASIDDQIRICKDRIAREGWDLVQVYRDAGISGASTVRAGYQALLAAARDSAFDVVVAEALDRLSRDQEDVAALFKRLTFAGIRIVTLSDGEISELHVGLKGTMNALFLKDLADKTRRGLRGRIEAGKSAGGISYGYRVVRQLDANGEPVRGGRVIDLAQAEIVRRIFAMFAGGTSPIAIAKVLNGERIPGPEGRNWRDTTIRGHAGRGTGILRNELYAGRLVWNRMHFIKDPSTGKRVSRINPSDQWVRDDQPELQIVDHDLWDRVQHRLGVQRATSGVDRPGRPRYWEQRRVQHLLSGKVICGACGGPMTNIGSEYLACSAARRQGMCDNGRGIKRPELDKLILDALREQLMQPEHVAAFIAEFTAEWNRLQATASAQDANRRHEFDVVSRKLDSLVEAIAGGLRASSLQQKLTELEAQKAALEAELGQPVQATPRLHPNLAGVYRDRVARLQDALDGTDAVTALEALRGLIEQVILYPAADGRRGFQIELIGQIAAMLRLGSGAPHTPNSRANHAVRDMFEISTKVVAGTGFEPVTFRL